MTQKKLTKAQKRVLDEVMEKGEFRCAYGYAPAMKLIDEGLVVDHVVGYGSLRLTPAPSSSPKNEETQ